MSRLLGPLVMKSICFTQREELKLVPGTSCDPETALNGFPARECLSVGTSKRYIANSLEVRRKVLAKPAPTNVIACLVETSIFNET